MEECHDDPWIGQALLATMQIASIQRAAYCSDAMGIKNEVPCMDMYRWGDWALDLGRPSHDGGTFAWACPHKKDATTSASATSGIGACHQVEKGM